MTNTNNQKFQCNFKLQILTKNDFIDKDLTTIVITSPTGKSKTMTVNQLIVWLSDCYEIKFLIRQVLDNVTLYFSGFRDIDDVFIQDFYTTYKDLVYKNINGNKIAIVYDDEHSGLYRGTVEFDYMLSIRSMSFIKERLDEAEKKDNDEYCKKYCERHL